MPSERPSADNPASCREHRAPQGPSGQKPRPPRAPRHLSAEARAIWKRIAPELHSQGRLSPLNADLLGIYCTLLAQAHRAENLIEPGLLTNGRGKELVTNPAWRIYRDAVAQLRVLAADLGLTTPAR